MNRTLNESTVELAALEWFEALGYTVGQLRGQSNGVCLLLVTKRRGLPSQPWPVANM